MLKRLGKWKRFYPFFLILLLEVILFLFNYQKDAWLIGWDNLYPELNFTANFKRNLFAVWQEYRGLGLPDGLAHAANLPHTFFLWLLHFVFPLNLIRYFFIFLMHFLGGLGIYTLLERIFLKNNPEKKLIALLGAIFYLLNLFTIQMFYAPLEVFMIHFTFLPWLVFSLLNYLASPKKKRLLFFILLSILSLPQGFVPQVFLSYLIIVFFILFFFWLKQPIKNLGKVFIIVAIIFSVNAFWLLPYLYSATTNSEIIINSKINQMSNEDIYLKNKFRGNLSDVIFLKGFMVDVTESIGSGELDYIMKAWRTHADSFVFKLFASFLFFIAIFGIINILVKRKWLFYPFLASFFVSFFFLANDVPLISPLNTFLRNQFPIFKEVFRFPFTKFAILFVFSYALFLTYGVARIIGLLKKFHSWLVLSRAILITLIFLILFSAYPIFKGNFFFGSIRLKIPLDYFQTINFFKQEKKNTRIAILPQPSYWNWRFYRWGYRGSGFLWYGIEQPTLYRAFDPWSDKNENYYWELSRALYSQNKELFESVFEKYQINWLLVDDNMINPSSPKALYLNELEEMLLASDKTSLFQEFGKIKIYQVRLKSPMNNFVYLVENLPQVEPIYKWNGYDRAYFEVGNYFSPTGNWQPVTENYYFYPFRSLFSGRGQEDLEFNLEEQEDFFIFKQELPSPPENYELIIPGEENKELAWVDPEDLSKIDYLNSEVFIEKNTLILKVPKVKGRFSADIEPSEEIDINSQKNCHQFAQGQVENKITEDDTQLWLSLSAINANNCTASFWLPNLSHQYGYLITVKSRHKEGKSLLFWLENLTGKRVDIETSLPKNLKLTTSYIIQPPMSTDGLGYTLHFDNISIGRVRTENHLGKITVNQIPYNFLTSIKLTSLPSKSQSQILTAPHVVEHPNPSFYHVERSPGRNQVLVLSQAFHPDWQAYEINERIPTILMPVFGKRIKTHIIVNNWENGWLLDNQSKIDIIFLPQYLEYFGFLIFFLFGCFTLIFLVKSR